MDDTGQVMGMIPISRGEARGWNAQNYGIFHAVQEFHSEVRRLENLKRIRCWAIDIDGRKEDQSALIAKSPLVPSMIVESKNGYHLYWFAKDASVENYRAILESRLIPHFNADRNAKDLCRVLRTPHFFHCKNPDDKFKVRLVYRKKNLFYREQEMFVFFRAPERKKVTLPSRQQTAVRDGGFWERASALPCGWALEMLSGTSHVAGEVFDFKEHRNGTRQIVVNGKPTSSWIDRDGMIGSYQRGGPSICAWLYWYHKNWAKVADILKKVFNL